MIRTKHLEVEYGFANYQEIGDLINGFLGIDDLINGFLKENPDIELIDIKYQSNVSAVADSGVSADYYHTSALIIYKEN